MSKFYLEEKQGYIYIGEYFHKFGGIVPTEKKIGKTDDLLKIPQIDDFAFSLDFHTPDIYLINDVDVFYEALTVLLNHDNTFSILSFLSITVIENIGYYIIHREMHTNDNIRWIHIFHHKYLMHYIYFFYLIKI